MYSNVGLKGLKFVLGKIAFEFDRKSEFALAVSIRTRLDAYTGLPVFPRRVFNVNFSSHVHARLASFRGSCVRSGSSEEK